MENREAPRAGATVPRDPPRQPTQSPDIDAAVSEFYRRFLPTLVAFLMYKGAPLPDATDIAQDTMIKLYRRWSEIEQPEAWARTVASRAWGRMAKSRAAKENLVEDVTEHGLPLRAEIDVAEFEQRHTIVRALHELPPRQREIMALTLEGWTPTEIATELESTPEAVRASLMKARRTIATYLREAGNGR